MSISSLDSMYIPRSYSFKNNVPFKQTPVQFPFQPQQYNSVPQTVSTPIAKEPSLGSQLASSAMIMGPIMGRHVIMQPIQSTAAAKTAGKIYQSLLKKGALDAMTRDTMRKELIKIWQATNKTIIFITHSVPEAVYLADRVILLKEGQVAMDERIEIPRPRNTKDKK